MEAHVKANNCVFGPLETHFVLPKERKKELTIPKTNFSFKKKKKCKEKKKICLFQI